MSIKFILHYRTKSKEGVRCMKKLLIDLVVIVALLAFSSSALAINRASKEDQTKKEPTESKQYEKTELKEGEIEGTYRLESKEEKTNEEAKKEGRIKGIVPEKLPRRLQTTEKQKAEEKYDYFIDKNNNGIDDRQEKKSGQKPSPRPAVRPIPKEEQPVKPATAVKETGEKKKARETPKQNEDKRQRR
jgi:hypothetical protein